MIILAAFYFGLGMVGLQAAFQQGWATAVFPASGLALAALLLSGNRVWPGIWLGALALNLWPAYANTQTLSSASILMGCAMSVGATLEALAGAFLVRRFIGSCSPFDRTRDVVQFVVIAILSCTVSATIGVLALCVNGVTAWADFARGWFTWWTGDILGMLIVTPLLITWSCPIRFRFHTSQWLEATLLAVLLTATAQSIFGGWSALSTSGYPISFLVTPFLMWAAFRFGPRGAATAAVVTSGITIWGTLHGLGPYAQQSDAATSSTSLNLSLLLLQSYMAFTSVMVLVLAAVTNERQRAEAEVHNMVTALEQRVAERTTQLEETNQQLSKEIVERRHAEEMLREREERFRRVFEEGPVGIAVVGLDGRTTEVNARLCQMLGYTEQELRSHSIADITHPEDITADRQLTEQLFAGAISSYQLEKRYITKEGQVMPGLLTGTLIRDEQGQPLYGIGIVEDITERKQAESQLRQAKEELESRVEKRTAELRRRARQQEAVAELGRRALAEDDLEIVLNGAVSLAATVLDVDYSAVLEWLPDTHEAIVRSAVGWSEKLVQSKIPVGPNYFTVYAVLAGQPIIMDDISQETRFDISALMREQGVVSLAAVTIQVGARPYGILGVGHRTRRAFSQDDVNFLQSIANIIAATIGQRRTHEGMQQAKDEAERANLAKSEFLSRMSHELRTPLNAILGFGQILDMQDLTPIGKESVGHVLRGGQHLLGLINEVLDIARVEAGHMELSLEPVALNDLVLETCALVQPLAEERDIRPRSHPDNLANTFVLADLQRLKQVLLNLLSNAIKYNHDGGLVEVSCEQESDDSITIAVRDTGPGIAPQDLPKLFTPFERLGASTTEIEGTGLGLVLSRRMVVAMGGTLNVHSVLGQGTTFTIVLPRAEATEAQPIHWPEGTQHSNMRDGDQAYQVLYIEDNPSNLRLVQTLIQSRPGVTLLTAIQGSVGLDLARQHRPDLILLDLNLPDMHGSEVLSRLQRSALTRDIPVVVVSADATPNQVERLMAAGAKSYLTKPLVVADFLHTVDALLP